MGSRKREAFIEVKRLTRWKWRLLAVLRIRSEVDTRQLLQRGCAALLFGLRRPRLMHLRRRVAVLEAVVRLRIVVRHIQKQQRLTGALPRYASLTTAALGVNA